MEKEILFDEAELKVLRHYLDNALKPEMEKYLKENDISFDIFTEKREYKELCGHCDKQVTYKMSFEDFKPIPCPNCGKFLVPCTLCNNLLGKCITNCPISVVRNYQQGILTKATMYYIDSYEELILLLKIKIYQAVGNKFQDNEFEILSIDRVSMHEKREYSFIEHAHGCLPPVTAAKLIGQGFKITLIDKKNGTKKEFECLYNCIEKKWFINTSFELIFYSDNVFEICYLNMVNKIISEIDKDFVFSNTSCKLNEIMEKLFEAHKTLARLS